MKGQAPRGVGTLWRRLVKEEDDYDAVMSLLSISDEAASGIGFVQPKPELAFAAALAAEYERLLSGRAPVFSQLPLSVCLAVSKDEACVQPKSTTPQVGVTLRGFSHNLALLPASSVVQTRWSPVPLLRAPGSAAVFNLLVIPFPYRIRGDSFEAVPSVEADQPPFFKLRQRWLMKSAGHRVTAGMFDAFLGQLLSEAEREVGSVQGVVLPEQALSPHIASSTARRFVAGHPYRLFIAGVHRAKRLGLPENGAYVAIGGGGSRGSFWAPWFQKKHHRWYLDAPQIRRYHLGHVLDAAYVGSWAEETDVHPRNLGFFVTPDGISVSVLICEDLARQDPIAHVVRSVGPGLVIALLLDGPQKKGRWPDRYATILAEDPGSSVLTLTSLGMARRASTPGDDRPTEIALWKEAGQETREIKLPRDAAALVLTLSRSWVQQRTLDGRLDPKATARVSLVGVRAVYGDLPPWIDSLPDG